MEMDFWDGYYFNELFKIIKKEDASEVKGIYVTNRNIVIINLGADQWKYLSEEIIIKEMSKTITHETVHYILDDLKIKSVGEERICELLSDQSQIDVS